VPAADCGGLSRHDPATQHHLPTDMAEVIKAKVASGEYATELQHYLGHNEVPPAPNDPAHLARNLRSIARLFCDSALF